LLAQAYLLSDELDLAYQQTQQAQEEAVQSELTWLVIRAQRLEGCILATQHRYEQAEHFFEQAMRAFRKCGMRLEYARTLYHYGLMLLRWNKAKGKKYEQGLAYLAKMDRQLNRLTNLISELLDISRMQTGKLVFQQEAFDLSSLVQEIVENLQPTTRTHQLCLEDTEPVLVVGDRERIGQVLINLLTNAIKYSPQADKVIVHVARDQNHALVSVQDFGIGIAKEHQHKVFERFYQVTDSEGKTYPGLGIGLYISCQIVRRHGGRLWVESEKGEGATFHVTLPLFQEK